jgi:ribosomal protein S18 acetylase RimI-like enzyme
MKVRKANINDHLALVNLYKNDTNSNESKLKIIDELFKEILKKEQSHVYVCTDQKNVILGYIAIHLICFPMIAIREIYISDLYILKNKRGKGVGKKLIQVVEKFAVNNNYQRLMLNNKKTAESYKRDFYNKLGFKKRDEFSNFVKIFISENKK